MAQPIFKVGHDVAFEDAIDQARRRSTVLPDVYYGQMQGIARAQAFSVAGLSSLAQIRGVLNSLTDTLRTGKSFDEWKMEVKNGKVALDLPDYRLDNIFRTNLQTAYNRGIWESQKAHIRDRPMLMYDAINDSRTRPAHRAMDGFIAEASDPIWNVWYPPNGYRCFLPGTQVSGAFRIGLKSRYAGPAVELVTEGGRRLSVTANHPILTARGWVAAADIAKSDDLICDPIWKDGRAPAGFVDNQQAPATVEHVFDTLARDALGLCERAAFEFHDDAHLREGDVYVAGADSVLMRGFRPACAERGDDVDLIASDRRARRRSMAPNGAPRRDLVAASVLAEQARHVAYRGAKLARDAALALNAAAVEIENAALHLVVGGSGHAPSCSALAFDGGSVGLDRRPLDQFGGRSAADHHAGRGQQAVHRGTADLEPLREALHAFARGVVSDRVVQIRKFDFRGHVYDFETDTGLIVAQGILAHNCRCRVIALSKSDAMGRGWGNQPRPQVMPDKGWDYDIRQAPLVGVKRAVAEAAQTSPPKLARALNDITTKALGEDINEWRAVPGTQGGPSEGWQAIAPDGTKWYVKFPKVADQARQEVAAGVIHRMLGLNVPETRLVVREGRLAIASRWNDDLSKFASASEMAAANPEDLARIYQASIITKNWDAVGDGYDNIRRGADGKLWMVDSGASFHFRAQGGAKAYGKDIDERLSFLDHSKNIAASDVFGRFPRNDRWWEWEGQRTLKRLDVDAVRKAIVATGIEPKLAAEMADIAVWRQNALRELYDLDDPRLKPELVAHITALRKVLPKNRKPDFTTERTGVMAPSKEGHYATTQAMPFFEQYVRSLVPKGDARLKKTMVGWSGSSTRESAGYMKLWAKERFGVDVRFHKLRSNYVTGAQADIAAEQSMQAVMAASKLTKEQLFSLLDAEWAFTQWQLRAVVPWGNRFNIYRSMSDAELRGGYGVGANGTTFTPNSAASASIGGFDFGNQAGLYLSVRPWDICNTYWEGGEYITHRHEIEFIVLGGVYPAKLP